MDSLIENIKNLLLCIPRGIKNFAFNNSRKFYRGYNIPFIITTSGTSYFIDCDTYNKQTIISTIKTYNHDGLYRVVGDLNSRNSKTFIPAQNVSEIHWNSDGKSFDIPNLYEHSAVWLLIGLV